MATKYISDLSAVTTISDSDVLVIDDGTHNYKISWAALKALLKTVISFTANNATGNITITAADGSTFTVTPHDPTKLDSNDYVDFTGATGESAGTAGKVPAPTAQGKYLSSDGVWETPDSTPTTDSDKLITSGAVKRALDDVYAAMAELS